MQAALIQMFTDPVMHRYMIGVGAIVVATLLSIVVIISSTRRGLKQTAGEMMKLMKLLNGADERARTERLFHTTGVGEVRWESSSEFDGYGGLSTVYSKTVRDCNEISSAEAVAAGMVDEFFRLLAKSGFDLRDAEERPLGISREGTDAGHVTANVAVTVRRPDVIKAVMAASMTSGFRERHGGEDVGVDYVRIEDAQRQAGVRAIDDAIANIRVIADKLGHDHANFGLVDIRLDTPVSAVSGMVVRVATVSWRPSPIVACC